MLVDRSNAMPITIDHTLTCYIPWRFTNRTKLRYYEDSCLYFRQEEPHHDLEFLLTPVEYDGWDNVRRYSLEQVHPLEVREDHRDHTDMSSEEIEEYQELLWQLKHASKEESDDPSEDIS